MAGSRGRVRRAAHRKSLAMHLNVHHFDPTDGAPLLAIHGVTSHGRRYVDFAEYLRLIIEANLPVYFCDPHSPWQRGTKHSPKSPQHSTVDPVKHTPGKPQLRPSPRYSQPPNNQLVFRRPDESALPSSSSTGYGTTAPNGRPNPTHSGE